MATTDHAALAARLAGAVERVADAVANARPLVLTTSQLRDEVRAALRDDEPPAKKRKTATRGLDTVLDAAERVETDLPSPSTLTLSMLDAITATSPTPSPTPLPIPPSTPPPPAPRPTKKKAPRKVVPPPPPPPPPAPPAPVCPPPTIIAPSRPVVVIPPQMPPIQQRPRMVTPSPTAAAHGNVDGGRRYLWGNAWHHLPEDYEFPKESLEIMWRQWCCGVADKGYRPLRDIQASDIATTNNRKRLSDLKFLMKYIEQHLQERGVWKESPSEIEADQMLLAVRSAMPFTTSMAKNGQKRELEDLKWHSAVSLLRSANKKARAE